MTQKVKKEDYFIPQKKLENGMLTEGMHKVIQELYDKGMAKKKIARLLEINIKTVRIYIEKGSWKAYQRKEEPHDTLLAPHEAWLMKRMEEVGYNGNVLYRELKSLGYTGSYDTVRRFVFPHRQQHSVKACVRYETAPGEQSQMDWGSEWVWLGDQLTKVHFFALVLGYSRRSFAKGYLNERFLNLIAAHEEAFRYFGGLTQEILYDNPKTMVLSHDAASHKIVLNKSFQDFAAYHGFTPKFCTPYRPQTKGKIESGVKYLKKNFLPGRRFHNLEHLNTELAKWQREVADVRIHGTTHERPCDRFAQENLVPFLRPAYSYVPVIQRKVAQDAMVNFESNRYSVPWRYAGKCVDLKIVQEKLCISYDGQEIATHALLHEKHGQSVCTAHYAGLLSGKQTKRTQQKKPQHDPLWQERREGFYDVMARSLSVYEQFAQCLLVMAGVA